MNVLTATRSIIRSVWGPLEGGPNNGGITSCIAIFRTSIADSSDPVALPDPVVFICVFAEVLFCLVPEASLWRQRGDIYVVMAELAAIMIESDGSSWPYPRRRCVQTTHSVLHAIGFAEKHLISKLEMLMHTFYRTRGM